VICNNKQIIPVNIFPRSRKDRKGKKMAINVISSKLSDVEEIIKFR